jgi:sugar (pentulose or hexulose) kinase
MIADVTGVPVEVPEGTQFGAKGAALCAATALGEFADIGAASAGSFKLKRLHHPDETVTGAYQRAHRAYHRASEASLGLLSGLPLE